jgi:hypothetical protein
MERRRKEDGELEVSSLSNVFAPKLNWPTPPAGQDLPAISVGFITTLKT